MAVAATFVDFLHALLMVAWIGGVPLFFWHRWPRVSRAYALYAAGFIVANVVSEWVLGECFLTTLTRYFWEHALDKPAHVDDWFTVRFSELVFGLAPSHRAIKLVGKALIFVSAIGALYTSWHARCSSDAKNVRAHPGSH